MSLSLYLDLFDPQPRICLWDNSGGGGGGRRGDHNDLRGEWVGRGEGREPGGMNASRLWTLSPEIILFIGTLKDQRVLHVPGGLRDARGLEPTYPDAPFAVPPALFHSCSMGRRGLSDNRSSLRELVYLQFPLPGMRGCTVACCSFTSTSAETSPPQRGLSSPPGSHPAPSTFYPVPVCLL